MRVLIVDDSVSKVADIVSQIREVSSIFEVDSCDNCITALQKLTSKFDLIVLDMLLPLRKGDEPTAKGGQYVIKEIYRNINLNPPTYILCLTQFDDLIEDFHPIWRTIKYDPGETEWKVAIRELLIYISRQHSADDRIIIDKIPTIYLEGRTDEIVLSESIKIFFPNYLGSVKIKTDSSAGADWVTRQLVIWASSLPKDSTGKPIKSVGIYDNDAKGNEAIENLHRVIKTNSAEASCVKAFKYTSTHARHLIPLYQKGIQAPITMESMFQIEHWKYASAKCWLEDRNDLDLLLKEPKNWTKRTMSLNDHIRSLGLSESEFLYLSTVSNEYKADFCGYILSLDSSSKQEALMPFKLILTDVMEYLFK